jgi:thiamine-phosphate pyrophosphorylase
VAIGGINEKNAMQLKGSGIDGIAVISAIFAAPDKSEAAKKLLALAKEVIL